MTAGELYVKVFSFGKIDYNRSGRRNCPVEVRVKLQADKEGRPTFSAVGDIWSPSHTVCYASGQCLDEIAEYVHSPEFKEIFRLWKLYHLNDMHAGTVKQEEAVDAYCAEHRYDYTAICEYLKSLNLYEDEGYRYGSAWLYREIPQEDLDKIKNLLKIS